MDIENLYHIFLQNRLISTDSRNIGKGCIFFALKGENFNGNRFALQAIENGASAAIVDEEPGAPHSRIFKVENVLMTLQMLAKYHRQHLQISILAITGSNGKTTTKELCREVLSKKYKVYATQGNLNNHIGVPLTLLAMDDSIQIGIVEMGANHPGEIRELCSIAMPDLGIITNIGKAHLEGFGSIEGVARAKGELFEHLMTNRKTIFLNEGNEYIRNLVPAGYPEVIYYNGMRGLRVKDKSSNPWLRLDMILGQSTVELETRLVGGYNAENVLAACGVGLFFKVPLPDIKEAIRDYAPQNNRSQLIETGRNRVFMDSYNANPSSMRAAIDEFLLFKGNNKMLILGEMRELGTSSDEEHMDLVRHLRDQENLRVICIGNSFARAVADSGYQYFDSADDLVSWLANNPVNGHFILVKGSRANRLEKIIPML